MRRLALVAAVFVLCTGCKLSIAVGVDARSDGSGVVRATVTLDRAAAERLAATGGRLDAADLRKAGWTVTGPEKTKDGGAVLAATKPFNTPGELDAVIAEVAGSRHPLHDFRLTRTRSFARTRMKFSGVVDLTGGVAAFGDERLKEQTGTDSGVDAAELARQAGTTLNQFFSIRVVVRLPGSVSANAPSQAGNGAVWAPRLGERAALAASSSQFDAGRVIFVVIAFAGAVGLIVVLMRRRIREP